MAIGLPPTTVQFGFGTNLNLVSVNDRQGDTDSQFSAQSGSIYVTDWFLGETRYLGELYISKYLFEAEGNKTGEQVDSKGARFSVQYHGQHNKYFAPWYGVGIDISRTDFTKRHKVDSDGFLVREYDDLNKGSFNLIFNMMQSWSISADVDLGAKLEYSVPLGQTVNGFSASMLIIFRPIL